MPSEEVGGGDGDDSNIYTYPMNFLYEILPFGRENDKSLLVLILYGVNALLIIIFACVAFNPKCGFICKKSDIDDVDETNNKIDPNMGVLQRQGSIENGEGVRNYLYGDQ